MKKLLFLLLLLPMFAFGGDMDAPKWTYTSDQQAVLAQYGPPNIFSIVQLQTGLVRYETWFYFGLISKQYGFSNGKKVREAPLGFLVNAPAPLVTPDQFTFSTTRANLGFLFGPPTSSILALIPGINQVNLSYPARGLAVTMRDNKIVSIVSYPAVQ